MLNIDKNKCLVLKKKALAALTALAIALAGTSCAKKVENTTGSDVTTATTTTVESTIESSEPTVSNTTLAYETEAKSLYEENKAFFDKQFGNDKDLAIYSINNVITVLKNESYLETEALREAFNNMEYMFYPTNLAQGIGNYKTGEPVEQIEKLPDLSIFVKDKGAKRVINENNIIMNDVVESLNSGDKEKIDYSLDRLLRRIVFVENGLDETYQFGERDFEIPLNMSDRALIYAGGVYVFDGRLYYTDKDVEQVKYLVPDARDAAIIDAFYFNQIDGVEYEEADVNGVRAKGYLIFIPGYDEPQFITEAEYNKILNDLAVTKYNKVITDQEETLSNKSAEYYNRVGNCVPTPTLTK